MVMMVLTVAVEMLVWLQIKHFVADYLLQPKWVLGGKGSMMRIGGYVHAGIHAVGSIPAYLLGGLGAGPIVALVVTEFIVHYVIDFIKADLSKRSPFGPEAAVYWALHGFDQFMHQLTYIGLVVATAWVTGGIGG
jgi:hypothetical protein